MSGATMTSTGSDVPMMASAVDFSRAEPLRPDGALNVTAKVREDGSLSLVPNDTIAALVLHDLGIRARVCTRYQGSGPVRKMTFLSLDLLPNRDDATLTKDGTRHTEMVISSGDYEAVREFLQQRYDSRYAARTAKPKRKATQPRARKSGRSQ